MPTREIELSIEGMSCAACAVRIGKKLNKIGDVSAAVGRFRVRGAAPRPRAAALRPGLRPGQTA